MNFNGLHVAGYVLALGIVIAMGALLLHACRTPGRHLKVTRPTAIAIIGAAIAVGLTASFWPHFGPHQPQPIDSGAGYGTPDAWLNDAPSEPLARGAVAPALTAQGWVNGAPQVGAARFIVVDVWALW